MRVNRQDVLIFLILIEIFLTIVTVIVVQNNTSRFNSQFTNIKNNISYLIPLPNRKVYESGQSLEVRSNLLQAFPNEITERTLEKQIKPKIAFALLCTENYWRKAYILAHRIRKLSPSSYYIIILTEETLSGPVVSHFTSLNATIIKATVPMPNTVKPLQNAFQTSWVKLHLFTLIDFAQILYLDSDVILLKDITPVFRVDSFASVSLGCDLKSNLAGINGGFLLIKPNVTLYNDLIALASTQSPTQWKYSEQEVLSVYFVWMHPELLVSLGSHFMIAFNALTDDGLMAEHQNGHHWLFTDKNALDVLTRIYSVHFVCSMKPWQLKGQCEGFTQAQCEAVNIWHRHAADAGIWSEGR